jgi:hypothetical protein
MTKREIPPAQKTGDTFCFYESNTNKRILLLAEKYRFLLR